jgi:hypothetical protein
MAKWLRVPTGMHTNGTSASTATAATRPSEPSPPATPTASAPAATAQVQADQIEASFENGVLQIVVPKAEEAKAKRIQVRSGRADIPAASSGEDSTPS